MSGSAADHDAAILAILGRQTTQSRATATRYLILPSRRKPRWILSLANHAVAVASMHLYAPASKLGRVAKRVIALSLRCGILPGDVITVEPGSESRVLQEIRLRAGLPANDFFVAVSLGTPGANRKCTMQLMRVSGDSCAYVKLATQNQPKLSLQRETHLLRTLAQQGVVDSVPRLLDFGELDSFAFLVQSPGVGAPCGTEIRPAHWQFLTRLLSTVTTTVAGHLEGAGQLADRLQRHRASMSAANAATLTDALAQLGNSASMPVRATIVHGDFAPWNMMIQGNRSSQRLFVYDWEHGVPCGLPLFDAIHFQMQTGILVRRASPVRLLESMMQELKTSAAQQYLVNAGISAPLVMPLLTAYLVDVIVTGIEIDGDTTSELQRARLTILRHLQKSM